jgi:3-methyladenine DNA glycosylase Tag
VQYEEQQKKLAVIRNAKAAAQLKARHLQFDRLMEQTDKKLDAAEKLMHKIKALELILSQEDTDEPDEQPTEEEHEEGG